MATLMAVGELRCPSCGQPSQQVVTFPFTGLSEWSRGRREAELAERSQVSALRAEVAQLQEDLASTEADPFGPTAQYRGGPFCSNNTCPCAEPNLPCGDWAGNAELGAFCPCCGWNEAAHRIAREGRRRRTQLRRAERRVVATVRKQPPGSGFAVGLWVVRCGDRTAAFFAADSARDFAHRIVTEELCS